MVFREGLFILGKCSCMFLEEKIFEEFRERFRRERKKRLVICYKLKKLMLYYRYIS